MKKSKVNLLRIFLIVFILCSCLEFCLGKNSIINNIIIASKAIGLIGIFIGLGINFSVDKNKSNKFINRYVIPFYILLLITFPFFIKDFNSENYIYNSFGLLSFTSPFFLSTYNLFNSIFFFPSLLIIVYFIFYVLDKIIELKNVKNITIINIILFTVVVLFSLISYKFSSFLLENKFYNIFNIFYVLFAFSIGINIQVNNKNINKRGLYFIILVLFIIQMIYFLFTENLLDYRLRINFLFIEMVFVVSILYLISFNKNSCLNNNIITKYIILLFSKYLLFDLLNINYIISFIIIIIIILIIEVLNIEKSMNKINFKKININIELVVTILFLLLISKTIYNNLLLSIKNVSNNNINDVTEYLNPLVEKVNSVVNDNEIYSYIYIDDPDTDGYLNFYRLKYLLQPNEAVGFRDSSIITVGNEEEMLNYLNNTKVDYIIVKKSEKLERLLQIKIPENGLIFRKNNNKLGDLKKHFNELLEVK